jgi:hypothetical protein
MRQRCWAAVLCIYAILAHTDKGMADDQSAFVVEMTHAIYAKGLCPGVDIVYEDLVRLANTKKLNAQIVEDVRNGVKFLNSEGRKGEKGPDDIMDGVTVAANVIAIDQSKIGTSAWCNERSPALLKDGFIRTVEAATAADEMNARVDEQFAKMRKGLPEQISPYSKLTNVSRAGATLSYLYQDTRPASLWSESQKIDGAAALTKLQCEGKNTRALLESGYSMVFKYVDKIGTYITQVSVDKSNCR